MFDLDIHDVGHVPEMMGRNLRRSLLLPSGLAELDLSTNTTVSWLSLADGFSVVKNRKSCRFGNLCEMIASCGGGCCMGIKRRAMCYT